MDLTYRMSPKERLEMKRKRIAFIQETTKGYSSIEEYARDKDEWFAIIGINLQRCDKLLSLCIYLDPFENEYYFISMSDDGRLIVDSYESD